MELPQPSEWSAGARSETGYKRSENQDRMSRISTAVGDAYIVSDGMGGHKGGATAAQLTVEVIEKMLAALQPPVDLDNAIRQAFIAANARVYNGAHAGDPQTEGMGATGLLLLTQRSSAVVAHVGDSRAYLARDGELRRLTRDHTRVQRMIDAGMLTEEQARDHPDSSVLERAMGHQPNVEVDVSSPIELEYGDEILLCSDGLSSYVDQTDIEAVLAKPLTPTEQVDELVTLSLRNGGYDNVTVQVIRYEGGMNERKKQMLIHQLAFLPLVVVVAAATAVGMDYLNRAPSPVAASSSTPPPNAPAADSARQPVAAADPTVDALKQQLTDLKERVTKLEDSKSKQPSAQDGQNSKRKSSSRTNGSNAKSADTSVVRRSEPQAQKPAGAAESAPKAAGVATTAAPPQTTTTSVPAAASPADPKPAGPTTAQASPPSLAEGKPAAPPSDPAKADVAKASPPANTAEAKE